MRAMQTNIQGKEAASAFAVSLRKQADSLGVTETQTLAYEGAQHQVTAAERQHVGANFQALAAHERHENVSRQGWAAAAAMDTTLVAALAVGEKASIDAATQA